jgi:hypothetical protein
MRTENVQHKAVSFGEITTLTVKREVDLERPQGWKPDAHLAIDADPPEELVVDTEPPKGAVRYEIRDLDGTPIAASLMPAAERMLVRVAGKSRADFRRDQTLRMFLDFEAAAMGDDLSVARQVGRNQTWERYQ